MFLKVWIVDLVEVKWPISIHRIGTEWKLGKRLMNHDFASFLPGDTGCPASFMQLAA
jgi:hypothetical protein